MPKMMIPCTDKAIQTLRKFGFTDMEGKPLEFPGQEGPYAKDADDSTVEVRENDRCNAMTLQVKTISTDISDALLECVFAADKAMDKPLPAGF